MLRYLSIAALFISPSAAFADPQTKFIERDGLKFEYASELIDGNRVVLKGQFLPSHKKFDLVVSPNGMVMGEVDGQSVDFALTRRQREAIDAYKVNARLATAQPVAPTMIAGR